MTKAPALPGLLRFHLLQVLLQLGAGLGHGGLRADRLPRATRDP
ncbi:hypothetical protein [Pseudomonas sp.]